MTDIVERLRTFDAWEKVIARHKLTNQAADEIERLRAALREIAHHSRASSTVIKIARETLGDD